jgi:hypothetical protein
VICIFAYRERLLQNSRVGADAPSPADGVINLLFHLQRDNVRYLKRRWPKRIAWAIVVNCGLTGNCHCVAASAQAFSLMFPSCDRWSALPGRPDFSNDKKATPLEECATRTSGRGIHLDVKGCGSVPRGKSLSAGAALGSGARCPIPQSPHVLYCRKSLSASFGSSSFLVRNQCTPTFKRRQQMFLLELNRRVLLREEVPNWGNPRRTPSAGSPSTSPHRFPIVPENMSAKVDSAAFRIRHGSQACSPERRTSATAAQARIAGGNKISCGLDHQ